MNTFIDSKRNNKHDMGIYIHIPFCVRKCVYCDFLSAPADDETKKAYMEALIREIEYFARENFSKISSRKVQTIFIGGGTPTVVDAEYVVMVLDTIRKNFPVDADAEVTIECNPGTLDKNKAEQYVKAGINRISFGLQSADDSVLAMLGRIHTFAQFKESVNIAKSVGVSNFNVDIMSALPGQSLESYVNGLNKVLAFEPSHISAYSLIVEEGTPLCDNPDKFQALPDEDTEREMYYETDRILKAAGYTRYEISNYSKKGKECRHNLSYWERTDYIGFGIGAASLFDGKRMSNITDISEYIAKAGLQEVFEDVTILMKEDAMEEFMFLGLRKMSGISFEDFLTEFDADILDVYGVPIKDNIRKGLLEYICDEVTHEPVGVRLTSRGIDISNIVLSDFLLQ